MANGYYVYAVQPRGSGLPAGLSGLGGAPLSVVYQQDLAAVVSACHPEALRPTADLVLCHESIVEALRRNGPGLPARFGTVLASRHAVARALADRHAVLASDLERLGDKVELGLTVLWSGPNDAPERADGGGDPAVEPPGSGSRGPGARYLLARLAASRREEAERSAAEAVARELDRKLGVHAIERRSGLPRTRRMATRSAYLVHPARLPAFQQAFEAVRAECAGLRLLLSGPWPPYSFVTPPGAGSSSLARGLDDLGSLLADVGTGTGRASDGTHVPPNDLTAVVSAVDETSAVRS